MGEIRSKSNEQLFNWLGEITTEVRLLGGIVQNEGHVPSKEQIEEFNQIYGEVIEQLESWHSETLRKFKKLKLEDEN